MDQGPSRRQPERRRLSALSPADHRRRQVDGNIERRDSRALPSGLLRCVARRAGSGGAAGAGARGLNLSEAKGRDVCAVPTLPVWPGPTHRRRWSRICTRHMRRRRELRRHALDDDCRREAHRPRGQPRAFEQGLRSLQRPDKAGGSADCCRSTTGWCALVGGVRTRRRAVDVRARSAHDLNLSELAEWARIPTRPQFIRQTSAYVRHLWPC